MLLLALCVTATLWSLISLPLMTHVPHVVCSVALPPFLRRVRTDFVNAAVGNSAHPCLQGGLRAWPGSPAALKLVSFNNLEQSHVLEVFSQSGKSQEIIQDLL